VFSLTGAIEIMGKIEKKTYALPFKMFLNVTTAGSTGKEVPILEHSKFSLRLE
jgi:hypothetical protein